MVKALLLKLKEALISVLPITAIVLIISFTPLTKLSTTEIVSFAISAIFLILGIGLFNLGSDLAMTPMGEHIGSGLIKSKKVFILIAVSFVMGVLITIAEPDLSVLAEQVKTVISPTVLIMTVGLGVGLFLVISILKILFKKNLSMILMFFYMLLFAFCAIMIECGKADFLALAFDSGGVTTGPITVPFIMALGFGIANTVGGRNSNENSFGLIALAVLAMTSSGEMIYELADYSVEASLSNFGSIVLSHSLDTLKALGLIIVFFLILQFTILKLPKKKLLQIGIGIIYTFLGLTIFFVAVSVGFMPIGFKLGEQIAEFSPVLLVFIGILLGMVVVLAEPAVHVLNKQVEEVTGGGVKKIEMLIALSIAVGLSIGLSLIRMIFKFSILYYLIPGYAISLGLSFFVPRIYTAIAFDSGGVASGPLTSSFILPLAIGACVLISGNQQNVLTDAFGVVAMVAMTPLITIQTLGFKAIMSAKVRNKIAMKRILSADDEQIIYFD